MFQYFFSVFENVFCVILSSILSTSIPVICLYVLTFISFNSCLFLSIYLPQLESTLVQLLLFLNGLYKSIVYGSLSLCSQ